MLINIKDLNANKLKTMFAFYRFCFPKNTNKKSMECKVKSNLCIRREQAKLAKQRTRQNRKLLRALFQRGDSNYHCCLTFLDS